jgi:signal transduction histidine kinase
MQLPIDASGLLPLGGLLVHAGIAVVYAALFVALCLTTEPGRRCRSWTAAFVLLALGFSVMSVRFVAQRTAWGEVALVEGSRFVQVGYLLYLLTKLAHAPLILLGTLQITRSELLPRARIALFLLPALALVAALLLPFRVDVLIAVQAPLITLYYASTAWILWRSRVDLGAGAGTAIVGALGTAAVWPLWAVAHLSETAGNDGPARLWLAIVHFGSYVDLALLVPFATGLVMVLVERTRREKDFAEGERRRLESEVADLERVKSLGLLISGLAHELNNPLTAILGFSEELELRLGGPQARAAQVVREQAERCRGIVARLSVLSGAKEPERVQVEFDELVPRVVRGLQPMARRIGATLELDLERSLSLLAADSVRLEQVFVNLCVNALQFSPPGGTVRISSRLQGVALEFAVEDQGPGVPLDMRKKILEPFFTTRSDVGGTGLGLALVHEILRRCGGELIVGDRRDNERGARFVARIPILGAILGEGGMEETVLIPELRKRGEEPVASN